MVTGTALEERLLIPVVQEGKPFYDNSLAQALRSLRSQGYEPVFMPELADARTNADKASALWRNWWTTPSVRATGRTKGSSAVVVYAHVPNYLSEPDNTENAKKQGLRGGAGIMPQQEFQRLVDLEDGERIFVVDYEKLRDSESGVISVKQALEHPQTIPFLGGETRAQAYLRRYEEIYGNRIGIWYIDDLSDKPLGRVLFLGDDYNDDLVGNDDLGDDGRFVGVRAGGAAPRKTGPTQAQLIDIISEYVAPINRAEVTRRVNALLD